MSHLSRRTFLRGAAAMPLALWAARHANAADPVIRYDIASRSGAAMLDVYADAVARMQALGAATPTSWTWQWYTHFVDGTTTKASEITRLFGGTGSTMGSFANAMWNTCQSHSGQNSNNFLPWHRMYLYFMEQVVRQVSGRAGLRDALLELHLRRPGASRGASATVPRLPTIRCYASLYRSNRTRARQHRAADPEVPVRRSDGHRRGDGGDVVQHGRRGAGICRAIDSGIHGRIHVLVGNSKNMGAVPYAARDPLFWVHHSSIDRMWASWTANGGVNPTTASWATKAFVFADGNGQRVSSALNNYFDTAALGYAYDALIPAPTPAGTTSTLMAATTRRGGTASPKRSRNHELPQTWAAARCTLHCCRCRRARHDGARPGSAPARPAHLPRHQGPAYLEAA